GLPFRPGAAPRVWFREPEYRWGHGRGGLPAGTHTRPPGDPAQPENQRAQTAHRPTDTGAFECEAGRPLDRHLHLVDVHTRDVDRPHAVTDRVDAGLPRTLYRLLPLRQRIDNRDNPDTRVLADRLDRPGEDRRVDNRGAGDVERILSSSVERHHLVEL